LSEGEYISLGWFERDDLSTVVEHLRRSPMCSAVGLWGRSMGAATALLHCDRDPTIAAICADSSFSSLPVLMREHAQRDYAGVQSPAWLLDMGVAMVNMRVKVLADFNTEDVVPLDHVRNCNAPALFVHAQKDNLVSVQHSHRLYDEHPGAKSILEIAGTHNSVRGRGVVEHAVAFFCRAFQLGSPPTRERSTSDCIPRESSGHEPLQEACQPAKPTSPYKCMSSADSPAVGSYEGQIQSGSARLAEALGQTPRDLSSLLKEASANDEVDEESRTAAEGPKPKWWPELPHLLPTARASSSTSPRTPRPLTLQPRVQQAGEVNTPPAVVLAAASPLKREGCEPLARFAGQHSGQKMKHVRKKEDKENYNPSQGIEGSPAKFIEEPSMENTKTPLQGALRRVQGAAKLQGALQAFEEYESQQAFLPAENSRLRDQFLREVSTYEKQIVYPSTSPELLSNHFELLPGNVAVASSPQREPTPLQQHPRPDGQLRPDGYCPCCCEEKGNNKCCTVVTASVFCGCLDNAEPSAQWNSQQRICVVSV